MRKILISILILILLLVGYLMLFRGLNIFNIKILSISEIQEENTKLDNNLEKLSTLTSIDQPKAMKDLNDSAKQLIIARDEYNDKVLYSSSESIAEASQGIKYEIETLWVKLGNHATKNGVVLKFELRPTGAESQYNLNFTVTGTYVSISEFIASIENDSSLNFRIEDFSLSPTDGSTETLQAKFVVNEVNINLEQASSSQSNMQEQENLNAQSDLETNNQDTKSTVENTEE